MLKFLKFPNFPTHDNKKILKGWRTIFLYLAPRDNEILQATKVNRKNFVVLEKISSAPTQISSAPPTWWSRRNFLNENEIFPVHFYRLKKVSLSRGAKYKKIVRHPFDIDLRNVSVLFFET